MKQTENTLARFFDNKTTQKAKELLSLLTEDYTLSSSDLDISPQLLKEWIRSGLIVPIDHDPTIRKRHKFTFENFIWLRLVQQLRGFGLNVAAIVTLRQSITHSETEFSIFEKLEKLPSFIDKLDIDKREAENLKHYINAGEWKKHKHGEKTISIFQLLIAEAIQKKQFVSLAVFIDGSFLPLPEDGLNQLDKNEIRKLNTSTHLKISITGLLADILGEKRFSQIATALKYYSLEEQQILTLIQSKKYKSITVKFSNKKIDCVELIREVDTQKKIVDILAESNYQSISIVKHNGEIVKIQNTVKIKL